MNRAWIFQANPTRFDIGGFLASGVSEIEWLVSGYRSEITPGDDVYLWRSAGDGKEPAGIYAAAETVSSVRVIPDDGPASLWKDPAEALVPKHRVRIALTRVAKKREFIKRDWWKDDPILRDHLIMRMAAQTTFPLEGEERRRFERIWSRTGADWTYADAVAGLHAYVLTQGKEVSKLPGSPVADVSLVIGRPVTGTYNKVMNFRAIDPRDARAGLAGASVQDRAVWAQFYDPATGLREEEVHAEFRRLWTPDVVAADSEEVRRACEAEADRLSAQLTLEELLALWQKRKAGRPGKPRVNVGQSRVFDRNPLVVAIARERADWRCEVPGCAVPLFLDNDGVRFVEVHHIQTLASGGDDTPENVACLCPLHHREAHFGKAAADLAEALRSVRANGAR
jgi:hypothetical protein